MTGKPAAIRPERRDEDWPPENLLIQVAKSRWLRIQSVNHVFALTLTLDVTQNDKSGLRGKCSSCDEYFTIAGPGLARNPAVAMKTLQRQFDKHCRQVHREDFGQAAARIVREGTKD
jgi:hypothetical protein